MNDWIDDLKEYLGMKKEFKLLSKHFLKFDFADDKVEYSTYEWPKGEDIYFERADGSGSYVRVPVYKPKRTINLEVMSVVNFFGRNCKYCYLVKFKNSDLIGLMSNDKEFRPVLDISGNLPI
jgi:hypothetical protein